MPTKSCLQKSEELFKKSWMKLQKLSLGLAFKIFSNKKILKNYKKRKRSKMNEIEVQIYK